MKNEELIMKTRTKNSSCLQDVQICGLSGFHYSLFIIHYSRFSSLGGIL
jgi:hypothetical protein